MFNPLVPNTETNGSREPESIAGIVSVDQPRNISDVRSYNDGRDIWPAEPVGEFPVVSVFPVLLARVKSLYSETYAYRKGNVYKRKFPNSCQHVF
jgi:hypothetical protein